MERKTIGILMLVAASIMATAPMVLVSGWFGALAAWSVVAFWATIFFGLYFVIDS